MPLMREPPGRPRSIAQYLEPYLGAGCETLSGTPGQPCDVDTLIDHIPLRPEPPSAACPTAGTLAGLAEEMLDGTLIANRGIDEGERVQFLNGWLRFVTASTPAARARWPALAASGLPRLADRDAYALALWRRIEQDAAGEERLIHFVERNIAPWRYYRDHLFGWFLGRFNVVAARRVLGARRGAGWLHAALLACAVALACWTLGPPRGLIGAVACLLGGLAAVLAGGLLLWLSPVPYLNSLVPRLGAAVGIGYLFLLNAPQVAGAVYRAPRRGWLWLLTLILLGAALAYIALHVGRRVHPRPRLRTLLRRGFDLWLLALFYATLGLGVVAPVLFSPRFEGVFAAGSPRPEHLALCAAIALNLGVILQLAWDEKPLTEPL